MIGNLLKIRRVHRQRRLTEEQSIQKPAENPCYHKRTLSIDSYTDNTIAMRESKGLSAARLPTESLKRT